MGWFITSHSLTIRRIIKGVRTKGLEATVLFQVIGFLDQKIDATNTTCIWYPLNCYVIMMFYKKRKAIDRLPDEDIDMSSARIYTSTIFIYTLSSQILPK